MLAIYKREMRSYFTTSAGYVFAALFLALSGILFGLFTMKFYQTTDVSAYYRMLMFAYVIVIPMLTMKTFAEERRTKTEQLLLTAPVSLFSIVFAKFLAAFTMFIGTLAITWIYMIPLGLYGKPNMGRVFGCMIAVALVGMCFIAIGIFVSALTDNQFTAVIGTVGILAVLLGVAMLNSVIDFYPIRVVLSFFSIYSRYSYFTYGLFDYAAAVYYISVAGVFLFLAVRVFERRRWR
ncbi:MAG: ABC transporter [Ruminococcaceae bacterium]|nr:ABC transporter [Oscillospiraceae bacterium]